MTDLQRKLKDKHSNEKQELWSLKWYKAWLSAKEAFQDVSYILEMSKSSGAEI